MRSQHWYSSLASQTEAIATRDHLNSLPPLPLRLESDASMLRRRRRHELSICYQQRSNLRVVAPTVCSNSANLAANSCDSVLAGGGKSEGKKAWVPTDWTLSSVILTGFKEFNVSL